MIPRTGPPGRGELRVTYNAPYGRVTRKLSEVPHGTAVTVTGRITEVTALAGHRQVELAGVGDHTGTVTVPDGVGPRLVAGLRVKIRGTVARHGHEPAVINAHEVREAPR